MYPILPILVGLPFAGALAAIFLDRHISHNVAIGTSVITFLMTLLMLALAYTQGFSKFSLSATYIPSLNLSFDFALTQPTLILIIMTSIVFLAAALVGNFFIKEKENIYATIFLIAEGSSFAVFATGNLLLLYAFWEVAEFMMFFIIFIYGGYSRRYASLKFIIYSIFSSLLLLIGIILLYNNVTPHTFYIPVLIADASSMPLQMQFLIFVLLLGSFMIKMPVFPLHTWLPDAHTEAPTTGSMVLAGILLKFGGYGLFLMLSILPIASRYATDVAFLFVFSAVYASIVALRQNNIKRMIAYISITDMGIIGIGLLAYNALGTNGAFFAMLGHGIVISLLFLIAGTLDELYGTLDMDRIKGVVRNFPELAYLFIIGSFSVVGMPLTIGFIADLLIFFGMFNSFQLLGIMPLLGILLIGLALFWAIERTFLTPADTTEPYNVLQTSVIASCAFLLGAAIIFGVFPFLLL